MNTIKVGLGIFAGVAVGVLAGILFVPAKGTYTRRKIIHFGEEYSDEVSEKCGELVVSITEQYEEAKQSILQTLS